MITTNLITKTIFELIGDNVKGGYVLNVNGENIPLFLNKDSTTKYPQIRIAPFIEKGDTVENGYKKIKEYEKDDKKDGIYEPNYYDVVNEKHESQM